MVSVSFEIALVPDRLTTTGVPPEASAALMPPPSFSGIEVIDGAFGAVSSSTLSVVPLATRPVAETLTRSTIAPFAIPELRRRLRVDVSVGYSGNGGRERHRGAFLAPVVRGQILGGGGNVSTVDKALATRAVVERDNAAC